MYQRALNDRPHEYVFKNEIANQLFVGKHNPDISGMLLEFRVGSARLDAVIVNGTTTCYEIKTDRDELTRLPAQLAAAGTVFDKVYVVTTARYLNAVAAVLERYPKVGIYVLGPNARFSRVRLAGSNLTELDPGAIFDCLRQAEYMRAVHDRLGNQPTVPNTRLYATYRTLFNVFGPREAHKVLVESLRRRAVRRGDAVDHVAVPYELRALYFDASPKIRARYAVPALYNRRILKG